MLHSSLRPLRPRVMLGERRAGVHAGRYTEQTASRIHCICGPIATDTFDHPPQDGPKVAIRNCLVERFQRGDHGVDFDTARKRLTTAAEKDQGIGKPGWSSHVAGSCKADTVEIEGADEEVAEFRIVVQPVL